MCLFGEGIELNLFVFSLSDLKIYIFSLDDWLYVSFSVDFSSRSHYGFNSFVFSNNRCSLNRSQIYYLVFLRNELDLLFLVDYFSLQNGLIINFSIRSVEIFGNYLFRKFGRSQNFSFVNDLILFSLNIQYLLLNIVDWLNVSLSKSLSSWNLNRNLSDYIFIIDNGFSDFLFGVNWSPDFFFSDDGSLNNSLSNNWLRNNSLGDDGLTDDFSLNLRLRNYFLSLHDLRSGVENLIIISLTRGTVNCLL